MSNAREMWIDGAEYLATAGIESARLDARVILAHVLGVAPSEFLSAQTATAEDVARYRNLLERRAAREPVAYITGEREFWSLPFAVGPGVLVPRPETETLLEEAFRAFPDQGRPLNILDLGTGSGCLLIAFLRSHPMATGTGIESSADAIRWARKNADRLNVSDRCLLREEDWSRIDSTYDLIFANPPYIREQDAETLDAEVLRFEPADALFAGEDGLDAYRVLAPIVASGLKPNGRAFLEIGSGQCDGVTAILESAGLEIVRVTPDLRGTARCVTAGRASDGP